MTGVLTRHRLERRACTINETGMENNMYIYSLTFDYISVCANDDDDGDNE